MTHVYVAKKPGYSLEISYDLYADSPRCGDILGTFVMGHKKYQFGDEQANNLELYSTWDEWFEEEVDIPNRREVIYLPVYGYDHSGFALSTEPFADRWDSGQVGMIYCTFDEAKDWFKDDDYHDQAQQQFREEIEILNTWIAGEVYSYALLREDRCSHCNQDIRELLEGCTGFYGDNFKENGLLDSLPEEHQHLIDELKLKDANYS